MNTLIADRNWKELKGKISNQWSRFSNEELESVRGDISRLSDRIQKVYDVNKVEADRQYQNFREDFKTLLLKKTAKIQMKIPPGAASRITAHY